MLIQTYLSNYKQFKFTLDECDSLSISIFISLRAMRI